MENYSQFINFIPIKVRLMKFDNALTPRARILSPISILETRKDVYKRLFAKVNMRLVNVYNRFGIDVVIDNQGVARIQAIAATKELRI